MRVLKSFMDTQDNKYVYRVGDEYPREGYTPTPERIAELSGKDNALGTPIIQKKKKRSRKTV